MPDEEGLFLCEQHPLTRRHAVLEDDGQTIWLYLTVPDSPKPVTDVWVYNRVPAHSVEKTSSFAPSPPPVPVGYAGEGGLLIDPQSHVWAFVWSSDGEAVALEKDGESVAFVRAGQKPGFSRQLVKDGPWGHAWSEGEYRAIFGRR
jgi:hypothetical protein